MNDKSAAVQGSPAGIFLYYLSNLSRLVNRVEAFDSDFGSAGLLQARLAPDMFPLVQQVTTAVGFSLRALCPLAQTNEPEFGRVESYEQLKQLIQMVVDHIQMLPVESYNGFEKRCVSIRAGFADHDFCGEEYLNLYALPNFLFHYSMAYAILRKNGVPVGKRDFDGFHDYPVRFSFSE